MWVALALTQKKGQFCRQMQVFSWGGKFRAKPVGEGGHLWDFPKKMINFWAKTDPNIGKIPSPKNLKPSQTISNEKYLQLAWIEASFTEVCLRLVWFGLFTFGVFGLIPALCMIHARLNHGLSNNTRSASHCFQFAGARPSGSPAGTVLPSRPGWYRYHRPRDTLSWVCRDQLLCRECAGGHRLGSSWQEANVPGRHRLLPTVCHSVEDCIVLNREPSGSPMCTRARQTGVPRTCPHDNRDFVAKTSPCASGSESIGCCSCQEALRRHMGGYVAPSV